MEQTLEICLKVIEILDKEYECLNRHNIDSLADLNEEKLSLIPILQEELSTNYPLNPSLSQRVLEMQEKSARNSTALKAMMDATKIVMNAVQEAHAVHETGGTYSVQGLTPQGLQSVSTLFNRELGCA